MYCFVSGFVCVFCNKSAVTCQLSGCQVSQVSLLLRSLRLRNNIISMVSGCGGALSFIIHISAKYQDQLGVALLYPPPRKNKPQTKFLNELSNAFWLNKLLGQSKVLLDINGGFASHSN